MNKEYLKKSGQELQDYLAFRRRGSTVRAKKGKGSYSRKIKNKKEWQKNVENYLCRMPLLWG